MRPIAIFYHCLFVLGDPPQLLPSAPLIVEEQMVQMAESGLLDAATEIHIGVNGGRESAPFSDKYFPLKAKVTYHSLQSRTENPTIVLLEEWAKTHAGWAVLYLHCKGASHELGSYKSKRSGMWRGAMMSDLVTNWQACVGELAAHDIVCSHWMWNAADGTQHIPAGNFLWVKSEFAAQLPSIYLRERIKSDGIRALSSRYEAEVYWGNGPRPQVRSFRDMNWLRTVI